MGSKLHAEPSQAPEFAADPPPELSILSRFVRIFLAVALPLAAIAVYIDHTNRTQQLQTIQKQEELRLAQQVQLIHETFSQLFTDLIILSKHNDFHHIPIATPATLPGHLYELATEFKSFHIYKPHYTQIRFINLQGMEQIRTEHRPDGVKILPPAQLQYKGNRNYFKQAAALGPHRIYISPMELNVEHGKLDQPLQPTIRMAMPLFEQGKKFGVLVINYDATALFHKLASLSHTQIGAQRMLLNMQGYWLEHPDASKAWGFLLPDRANSNLAHTQPELWEKISTKPAGQLMQHGDLYTFSRVRPMASVNERIRSDTPAELIYRTVPEDYAWILLAKIPADVLTAINAPARQKHLLVTILLLLAWAGIAWLLAQEQHEIARNRRQAAEKDAEMRNIVQIAFNGIITINERGIIESFNPAACKMFGYREAEALGQNVSIIVSPPDDAQHDHYIQRYIESGEAHVVGTPREVIARHKDGHQFPVELFVTAQQRGTHWRFIAMLHDISERKAMEEKLTALATTDGLTGLYNRAHFNERLHTEFMRAKRHTNLHLSLMILDADHFKAVNDHYGHPAGDAVLVAIAEQAQACVRETDLVARYGGEEFAIIMPDSDGDMAIKIAERLRTTIEATQVDYEGTIIQRTVSIGIATTHGEATAQMESEDMLLVQADQALYQAKESGRNSVVLFNAN